jgi:hypothetical protein
MSAAAREAVDRLHNAAQKAAQAASPQLVRSIWCLLLPDEVVCATVLSWCYGKTSSNASEYPLKASAGPDSAAQQARPSLHDAVLSFNRIPAWRRHAACWMHWRLSYVQQTMRRLQQAWPQMPAYSCLSRLQNLHERR